MIPTLIYSLYYFFRIFVMFNIDNVTAVSQHPKLLVVSYDAFRYDYFNRNLTPFMNELRENYTHADYMKNIFVTKTFPNHHTMATGLFPESHGAIGNEVFDPETGKVIHNSYALFHYNEEVAPIWTVNEKQGEGRHSGVLMWPGAEFKYLGAYPTFYHEYNVSWPWETRIDKIISWFTDPKYPINLGLLYIEEPDFHGHGLGINSDAFNAILKKLDNLTKYIYDKLGKQGLNDVNVIHLSDHGMQTITKEQIIDLNNFINQSDYYIVESSAGLQIFPESGKFETVYRQLVEGAKTNGHFTVYKKEEIPKRYHFGDNPRIAPIFIVADIRYAFNDIYQNIKWYEQAFNFTANNQTEFGVHGYDNDEPDMRPMFFAYGPIFKKHYKLKPFNNTDLFPMFCKILDISSCPAVNGTLENVKGCLETTFDAPALKLPVTFIGALALLVLGIALAFYLVKRRRNQSKGNYSATIHDENNFIPSMLTIESDREYHRNGNPHCDIA